MSSPTPTAGDRLAFLASTDSFRDLSRAQLAAIAAIAQEQTYDKHDILFHQGDPGNGFYLVRAGRVKVYQLSAQGREQILHIFGTGDRFAEVPAFDGKPFPAAAAALEPTAVLFFPRQAFLDLLAQEPQLAIGLLKSSARHLRRLSNLIDALSLKEVPSRLAAYLLDASDQAGQAEQVELTLSKRQLAALLGTLPETLSRVLYRLSTDGLIRVEGARIALLDRQALQKLSDGC